MKRCVHVIGNIEELHDGDLRGETAPVLAAVVRHNDSAVIAIHQILRVVGIDEQGVMIAVHPAQFRDRLAAIA